MEIEEKGGGEENIEFGSKNTERVTQFSFSSPNREIKEKMKERAMSLRSGTYQKQCSGRAEKKVTKYKER